jgi:osmotically-inducible protein OsmY
VRAAFGRVASHPSSILVSTCDGEVTLSGPVLASEVKDVIETVRGVRGVGRVVNELEVHDTAEGIPGLQGAGANQ